MSEDKEPILEKINSAVLDFVGNLLGDKAKESVQEAQDKIKDMSADALTKAMEMADSVIESLKLTDNEQVQDAKAKVKDFLKEQGLYKEE